MYQDAETHTKIYEMKSHKIINSTRLSNHKMSRSAWSSKNTKTSYIDFYDKVDYRGIEQVDTLLLIKKLIPNAAGITIKLSESGSRRTWATNVQVVEQAIESQSI